MSARELEIFQQLLNALHLSGRDSASKMFSKTDVDALHVAVGKLWQLGYAAEINDLPHSGYVNVRVQRNKEAVSNHPCCTCTQ